MASIVVQDVSNLRAIKDIFKVLNSNGLYTGEKKLYINAIDELYNLGYYKDRKTIFEENS